MTHEEFEKEAEKAQAKLDLNEIVKDFNEQFQSWEDIHEFGANFRFAYQDGSNCSLRPAGRKILEVMDYAPNERRTISDMEIHAVSEVLGEALAQVQEEPKPAVLSTPEPLKYPELAPVADRMQEELRNRIRKALTSILMDTLQEGDIFLLGALGIDGRQKILDVLSEECQTLKEDFAHGTSGTWTGAR
jgi:hypothetical protein